MAGTDSSQPPTETGAGPSVVLVGPQLGENIGAVARAMLNCALTDLRLVRPRDGWPNPKAVPMASGATAVLDAARLFETVEDAVADLSYVLATTARPRDMAKPELTPDEAAREIRSREARGERCGILFGPERIGLTNDEVVLADAVLTVPLHPGFRSLNLSQAVLLVAYEWFRKGDRAPSAQLGGTVVAGRASGATVVAGRASGATVVAGRASGATGSRSATKEEVHGFFEHLERALDVAGYFRTPETRPTQVRNLRNLFQRAALTEQEVRSLHGVVTMLVGRRKDQLG